MIARALASMALATALVPWTVRAQPAPDASAAHDTLEDNPEIAAMFAADQADRASPPIDWTVVRPRDEARLARIAELLEIGAVRTGQDFHYAAVLYQHGDEPSDYLTAHLLSVAALARGRQEAQRMANATLDRYLLSIGQSQVLGTQFTQGPRGIIHQDYDEAALPEGLRAALGQSREAIEQRRRELAPYLVPAPGSGE